mmetsp:Transcript_8231/g.51242  ORF Transcript_8231/g.51242 Transcript_8231/m.51242 type:complete len:154 (+) Transcript_8231:42-503(+)
MRGKKRPTCAAGEEERTDEDVCGLRDPASSSPPPFAGSSLVRFPIVLVRRAARHLHVHVHQRSSTCSAQHKRRISRRLLESFADRRTNESVGVFGMHCHGNKNSVLVIDDWKVACHGRRRRYVIERSTHVVRRIKWLRKSDYTPGLKELNHEI